MAGSFRDLAIWKKGYALLMEVYAVTAKYPTMERFGLTSQTRDAANGVIASIAEAHGRYYFADKARVIYIGRGECEEVLSHLAVADGLGYLSKEDFEHLTHEYEGLEIGLNKFIKTLKH